MQWVLYRLFISLWKSNFSYLSVTEMQLLLYHMWQLFVIYTGHTGRLSTLETISRANLLGYKWRIILTSLSNYAIDINNPMTQHPPQIPQFMAICIHILQALLLNMVVTYLESDDDDIVYGVGLSVAMLGCEVIRAVSFTVNQVFGTQTGLSLYLFYLSWRHQINSTRHT